MIYKTTIIIYSHDNPESMELVDLANEATEGLAYCSKQVTIQIDDKDLESDPDFDGSEFFNREDMD